MPRELHRSLADVLQSDLWPRQGISPDPEATLRRAAVAEVLMRIPEVDLVRLSSKTPEFS
jgi:hypothetical protein